MSKERIHSDQFAKPGISSIEEINITLNPEQLKELADLYQGAFETFQEGKLVKGKIIKIDSDGVLVDINYKSYGLIPRYEFGEHEFKKLAVGQEIEVILDELENPDGNIVLSYEKAKARRAWSKILKLHEEEKPVEGIITHKVKGGLSVDIGIPAFLPGSQIDLQRVTDFDQYVGQPITASILKVNQKRGNVIISRRKYLNDQRSEFRKQILDTLAEGQIIQGIVKNITNYGVFIDVGGVDGLLHITDMTWGRISHPTEVVKIGDKVTVKVLSFDKDNEKISLGLKQLNPNPWEQVKDKLKVGQKIKGRISSITDYGLFVEVAKGVEGLVHISEISWTDRIANLSNRYKVGEEIEVLIVSLDEDNRRMSLSVKQLEKNPWDVVDKEFKIGQKIKGKISNITDFGVFVQLLPGIDGLVHISDLSWTEHIEHPSDRYKIGDEVEAMVLAIDKENKKISLGIKQLTPDPWEKAEELYPVGTSFEGEISKIANFGAFVKLPMGIEGLIHNTTLLEEQGKKADALYKVGEKVRFTVVSVNKAERKLALSTKLPSEIASTQEESKQQAKEEKKAKKTTVKANKKEKTEQSKAKNSLQIALESALQKNEDKE
ncbi:MAG: 30S ribosomal protein S1 [Candidatus Babeliales bacterium]